MKKQLHAFAIIATFLKLLLIPQFASGQQSRLWATYYGGSGAETNWSSSIVGLRTDAVGNVYMTGATTSTNNIAAGGFQNTYGGGWDAFLVKFDANGKRRWATYYGASGDELGVSVATDAAGNVYLGGHTTSSDSIASGGFQNTYGGSSDAFLVKFDSSGNRLWATYYGGSGNEQTSGVATDAVGNVYLLGWTDGSNNLAAGGFKNTWPGGQYDLFLVKFDSNGNRLWATYYGSNQGSFPFGVATDPAGNVYITGETEDADSIASGGFRNTLRGTEDAFLVKFDAEGNRIWATYYGGLSSDYAQCIATDAAGNVYIGGPTSSTDNIAYKGFEDSLSSTNSSVFLVKFDGAGNRLWGTYYQGNSEVDEWGIATDSVGNVFMGGHTESASGIASGGFENTFAGSEESYVVKFDSSGNRLCATYYGHDGADVEGGYIAVDAASGNVYLANVTTSETGIASGGFQNTYGGNSDVFLVKFSPCTTTPVANFQVSDATFCTYNCINYTDHSSNAIAWKWSFPGAIPSSSAIQNPQGICYDSAGTYNVILIVSNSGGVTDTLTVLNQIKVFPNPPTPVITQHGDTLYCATDPTYTSYQWYDSTYLIPGATDTFLVITHGGNYNVAVHNEFGCFISVGITIAHNVGISEFSINNLFSLSPNPATNELFVKYYSSVGRGTLAIINVLGETMLSNPLPFGEGRGGAAGGEALNISNLPAGMYFLQMKTENGIDTKRFVKE